MRVNQVHEKTIKDESRMFILTTDVTLVIGSFQLLRSSSLRWSDCKIGVKLALPHAGPSDPHVEHTQP